MKVLYLNFVIFLLWKEKVVKKWDLSIGCVIVIVVMILGILFNIFIDLDMVLVMWYIWILYIYYEDVFGDYCLIGICKVRFVFVYFDKI